MQTTNGFHPAYGDLQLSDCLAFVLEPLNYFASLQVDQGAEFSILQALVDHVWDEFHKLCDGINDEIGGQLVVHVDDVRSGALGKVKGIHVLKTTPVNEAA